MQMLIAYNSKTSIPGALFLNLNLSRINKTELQFDGLFFSLFSPHFSTSPENFQNLAPHFGEVSSAEVIFDVDGTLTLFTS